MLSNIFFYTFTDLCERKNQVIWKLKLGKPKQKKS